MKRNQVEKRVCERRRRRRTSYQFFILDYLLHLSYYIPTLYFLALRFPIAQLQQFKFLFSLLLYLFRHSLANTSALVYFLPKELLLLFLKEKNNDISGVMLKQKKTNRSN